MARIKEIMVYHHSHFDIGYTHTQPVLLELQKRYMDEALALCEETSSLPEQERFYWTCETTGQLLNWLETATAEETDRLLKLIGNGQVCVAALLMHTTPLCTDEQLIRLLYPLRALEERYGITPRIAINHDINGQPWTFAQVLLDAGISLYTTAINTHFGGVPFRRPQAFYWEAPDGRRLLTFHGESYGSFTWICKLWEKNVATMKAALDEHITYVEQLGYEHDFLYMSTTNWPLGDNTPPDAELLELIRRFNEEGYGYRIRMATPAMLLERLRQIPANRLPVHRGDWTDYWNFGAGSSAEETRLNRRTKIVLQSAEAMAAAGKPPTLRERKLYERAWIHAHLYDEHTWGANISVRQPDARFTKLQWALKAKSAYEANSLGSLLLNRELEKWSGNPPQSMEPEGLLAVNPGPAEQTVELRLPEYMTLQGRHHYAVYYQHHPHLDDADWTAPSWGKVTLAPFSYKKIPLGRFEKKQEPAANIVLEEGKAETPFYRLSFQPETGRITELFDKQLGRQLLDSGSDWTFFQFVRETIDPLRNKPERITLFDRDVDKTLRDISCWNNDWRALRQGAGRLRSFRADRHADGITLTFDWEAPGVSQLEQKITLFADRREIECMAVMDKQDIREPESIYFAFPLRLKAGWQAVFDSAGTYVRLDDDQLPGVCRDYVTVDRTISLFDGDLCVTVVSPDAPLFQIGGFHFGRELKRVDRPANPLLLGWPVNNYWDTNFRASQPGKITVKYALIPFRSFDPAQVSTHAARICVPPVFFPLVRCREEESGTWLALEGEQIFPVAVKPAEDGDGFIVRLRHLGNEPSSCTLSFPSADIDQAFATDLLERNRESLPLEDGRVRVVLQPRQIMTMRLTKTEHG